MASHVSMFTGVEYIDHIYGVIIFLKIVHFLEQFRLTEKVSRKYRECPQQHSLPTINTQLQSSTSVTVDEPKLTHLRHPESLT